ncbi:MAG: 3-methyl-2-oxobutanoate hydroxymethyltransferase [Candidatus Omnitrophica bacterium]|nr:3-methyl-2-oxobutanoate hydroxymethyltransferase [Candidatus Omnitrophota bacterium]
MDRKKITITDLNRKKKNKEKITMLTAYDYPFASFLDQAEIDMILVGDSLGMVVLGYESTVPVTMDEMIHHCKAVRRGSKYALLVGDMPFMSYNISKEEAIRNAGRFMKEAGCDAVKLEGGLEVVQTVKAIIDAGIPVMAHLGLTPQTVSKMGGFKIQGKDVETARGILEASLAMEKVGVFSVLFECVPDKLAGLITSKLKVPTIGIGAGAECDGQVLVTHDLLGLFEKFIPKFVKQYTKLSGSILEALGNFKKEVSSGDFPAKEHTFTMKEDVLKELEG